ncbi:MAG: Holliday junction resolvase RuvX [Bacteroidota bacterium]
MPRILAIDYGGKRTGLAWTDPLQLIGSALDTVATAHFWEKLKHLMETEEIEAIVLGYPTRIDGSDSHITEEVRGVHTKLQASYPQVAIHLWDERFTSQMAMDALIEAGVPRKKRRDKALVDRMSATIMLQEFLQSR